MQAVQTLPAVATAISAAPATTRTVVVERYGVTSAKEIQVPRTFVQPHTVAVPRTYVYGEAQNHTVSHKVNVPEMHVGLREQKIQVAKTILEDSTTTVQVPKVGLRDKEIMVPTIVYKKKIIQEPYHYQEEQVVPIKVPRTVHEEKSIQVPVPFVRNRQHTVNEVRTTIVPRTRSYVEQHTVFQPRTVIERAVAHEQHIVERPRVYEQEAPRVVQTVIPGAARSYFGPARVSGGFGGYGFGGGFGGYGAPFGGFGGYF